MGFLSPVWAIGVSALCLALAHAVSRVVPFYVQQAASPPSRFVQIDGLRGFLALGVVASHVVSARRYATTGVWDWPDSAFYTLCGSCAVALFFMVTGFLFWKKAIDGHGRVDFRRLYVGRLRRLVPLYYVAIAFTFAYAGARTGWTLQVPPRNLVGSLARWGTFGLLGMQYPVNAFHDTWATNTAVWTLSYEWAFYLVLPALSWFAFPRRFAWLALPMLAATFLYPDRLGVVSNFVFGMAAAHVVHADLWARARASVWTPIAAVVGVLLLTRLAYSEYGFLQSLALFPAFLCVVSRNPACGFLEWRAARAIGTVSYSLYLLHCPVLYGFFYSLEGVANVGGMSASRYWAIMCGVVPAIVALSFLTYRWVEWPGLTLWPPRRLAEGAPAAGAR